MDLPNVKKNYLNYNPVSGGFTIWLHCASDEKIRILQHKNEIMYLDNKIFMVKK
jgi:hypothetical protein